MKYAIGPVQFFWPKQQLLTFYREVMESAVEVVYLGETVCSKRREMKLHDWISLAKEIQSCGKQVILSSMVLLEAPSEVSYLKKLCENGEFLVEANDFSAIQFLSELKMPFVLGSAINCYNHKALKHFLSLGVVRWNIPVELSRDSLQAILTDPDIERLRPTFETEILGYGHLPLAYSARCFTARSENRNKDDCQLCCLNYPTGREMRSQEGQGLFVLNGIQTLSGYRYNLINDLSEVTQLMDLVRISPSDRQCIKVAEQFRGNEGGGTRVVLDHQCNGYWHAIEGMKSIE